MPELLIVLCSALAFFAAACPAPPFCGSGGVLCDNSNCGLTLNCGSGPPMTVNGSNVMIYADVSASGDFIFGSAAVVTLDYTYSATTCQASRSDALLNVTGTLTFHTGSSVVLRIGEAAEDGSMTRFDLFASGNGIAGAPDVTVDTSAVRNDTYCPQVTVTYYIGPSSIFVLAQTQVVPCPSGAATTMMTTTTTTTTMDVQNAQTSNAWRLLPVVLSAPIIVVLINAR